MSRRTIRLFVHCGFHKTGTKSIQALVLHNRDRVPAGTRFLTGRSGIDRSFKKLTKAFHQFPFMPVRNMLERRLRQMREDAINDGVTTLFISFESISGGVPGAERGERLYPTGRKYVQAIRRVFAGDEMTLIFSTREPKPWIKSVYAHRLVTRGTGGNFEDFAALPKFRNMDWAAEIKAVTDGIDLHDVVVTRLEDTTGTRLGAGSDLLPLIMPDHGDFSDWEPVGRKNQGISGETQDYAIRPFMRFVPRFIRSRMIRRFQQTSRPTRDHGKD
jgi:hypothetical protein